MSDCKGAHYHLSYFVTIVTSLYIKTVKVLGKKPLRCNQCNVLNKYVILQLTPEVYQKDILKFDSVNKTTFSKAQLKAQSCRMPG